MTVPAYLLATSSAPGISGLDLVNLFSAAASIILAIVALALSIFFFVQSKNAADQSAKSAEEISASVARLEKLFDSLYSDTFTMMRETVTDMRHHVWKVVPGKTGVPDKVDDSAQFRGNELLMEELAEVSKRAGLTDTKITELNKQLAPIIERTVEQRSRVRGVRELPVPEANDRLRNSVLDILMIRPLNLKQLITMLVPDHADDVARVLFDLRGEGIVTWTGSSNSLGENTVIDIVPSKRGKGPNGDPERSE